MKETNLSSQDPILLEVIRNKLHSIANEMQSTLLQCAFSPLVKEGMDCSAALFTVGGETLSQATAIPVHLGTMTPALTSLLSAFPVDTLKPGDALILNDPYCGGSHLPDITVAMPVFIGSVALAICVTTVHHQDVGGMSPGSLPSNATDVFQEGLRIPPLKLMEAGELNETLHKILFQNSRNPEAFLGDIRAQLSACTIATRRLVSLAEKYDVDLLLEVIRELLDRSERMTRAAISKLPQGTFTFEDALDNDGVDLDRRIPISVAVTVKGDSIHYDFSGCSAQVKGPVNCVPAGAHAAANYATRVLTGADIPTNGGCFRPISLHLPVGSIVNPVAPAAVNARLVTIKRLCASIVSAFADVLPDRVPAAPGNVLTAITFGGQRPDKSSFMLGELIAAGAGAGAASDGVDCIQTDGSNSMNQPIEALMLDAPIRINCFRLRSDSGGDGEYRGGLGVIREYESLVDGVRVSYRGERHHTQARGSQGGEDGRSAKATLYRKDGTIESLESKCMIILNQGDRLAIETAGGGGFGRPTLRTTEARDEDLRNRKVTRTGA
ncbi:Acetophenone carboxylase delta subunit [Bordetella sputigena]|uniref:hydantoinase B/oxoprolinase family protein n=1 Tax=Bordetella sputigena TaxID=1416810 RepID=UPI0039F07D11